jgi:hypothetical protein
MIRSSKEAFEKAIENKILSKDPIVKNYAGKYMYMYSDKENKIDKFKHIDTRKYIESKY